MTSTPPPAGAPDGPETSEPVIESRQMTLTWFAIFNPNISHGEDSAEDNILWFHPPATPIDDQLRAVGLCSAFTCFKDIFTCGDVESFTTDGSRIVMEQVETDFWFACAFRRKHDETFPSASVDRDEGTADAARRVMRLGHAAWCMMAGTLSRCLAQSIEEVTVEEETEARRAQRPMRKAKHLRVEAARLVRPQLLSHSVDLSMHLAAAVASPRGSMGVRDGLEYLSVDAVGCLHIGSFARRLHNAHPNTIAHSVMVLANKVAFTTLPQTTTATLLGFIAKAEADRRGSGAGLAPEVLYMQQGGRVRTMRGEEVAALRVNAPGQNVAPLKAGPSATTGGTGFFNRVANLFSGEDAAAATASTVSTAGNHAVLAHNAMKRCFVDDRPMGLLCFRQGDFSLYCMVDEKFVDNEVIRAGVTDSVAVILMEEAAALDVAQAVATATSAKGRRLENEVVYSYRNTANLAWKTSAHVKTDDASRSEMVGMIDVMRHSDLLRNTTFGSIAARVRDTAWAFVDRHGEREFAFGFGTERPVWSPAEAFSQADDVRRVALVGLSVD